MIIASIFWLCIFLLAYSYLFYPIILQILSHNKHNNSDTYNQTDNLPFLSILLSAYNEELFIEQRIHNLFTTNYPSDKYEILVGSDGSVDNTNLLLKRLTEQYSSLHIFLFNERSGKANVINQLIYHAKGEILLLTDAKALFSPNVFFQLTKHFKNPAIGIVGGNIITKNHSVNNGSVPEKMFMNNEIRMKYNEGRLWGTTIGVYGACYAIRKELFSLFPANLAVDDFYSNMHVLKSGKKAILEINALCFENVPNQLWEEFRRKIRISTGNFQNLSYFKSLIFKANAIGFCFFSHKVLRWMGPLLLLVMYIANLLLVMQDFFYLYTLAIQLILITIPLIDFFLHIIRIDILILRFITHFYTMNLALFIGLVKHLKGVKTNVWEPTKRQFFKA